MSQSRTTLSAQVDSDTELAQQFEEYRDSNAMTSKSEAVRHLVRAGLEQELEQLDDSDDDDSTASDDAPAERHTEADISVDIIRGNEPIIIGFAFLVGFSDILAGLTTVAGELGAALFIVFGLGLSLWILGDVARRSGWLNRSSAPSDETNAPTGAE